MGDVGDAPKKLSMVHDEFIKTENFPTIPSTSSQTLIWRSREENGMSDW